MSTTRLILMLALAGTALACSPAQKENIGLLERFFGITPFYPNGELDTNGYTDDYIAVSTDLNCNFNTPDSPAQTSDPSPSQVAAVCKWKNMLESDLPQYDNEQWYLFTKKDDKAWRRLKPKAGKTNTPKQGDGFALAGGEGKIRLPTLCKNYKDQCVEFMSGVEQEAGVDWANICEEVCAPAPQAVLYSAPMLCLENEATLEFDFWLLTGAGVRVMLLEQDTLDVLYEVPMHDRTLGCTHRGPSDGHCSIAIPPQTQPFHLAIHAHDLNTKFVIIDNIEFIGDLGSSCVYTEDPLDFGTTGTVLPSREGAGAITVAADLDADGGAASRWSNSGATTATVPFERHTAPVDADKWQAATGSPNQPTGDFFMAQGTSGDAELMSDIIDCQQADGALTFTAWMSEGTKLEVCVVDAVTLEPLTACDEVLRRNANDAYLVPIYGPFDDVRLLFRGSQWDSGAGGMVAIDDIAYDADLCVGAPTTAPEDPDKIDQPACNDLTTDFDEQTLATSKWQTYGRSTLDEVTVVTHGIDSVFQPTSNTAVRCDDADGLGKCAGVLLSRTNEYQVGIMESADFLLSTDRYLELKIRRGTWASMVYACVDEVAILNPGNGDIESTVTINAQCATLAGPALSYEQYTQGEVAGVTLPAGATKVFLVFTNPAESGAEDAGFLVDDIRLLRGDTSDSGRLCEGQRR